MDREDRIRRLKRMLRHVMEDRDPDSIVPEDVGILEESLGRNRAMLPGNVPDAIREGLRKAAGDEVLTDSDIFAVEAIVLPLERPVFFIRDNSYAALPAPWAHFADGEIRGRLERAIPSVGRLAFANDPNTVQLGTAFVVGDNLLMTNRHVAEWFDAGIGPGTMTFVPRRPVDLDFKREIDSVASAIVRIEEVVMVHPHWDMALLRVDSLPRRHSSLTLSVRSPEELAGREIGVIGYPTRGISSDWEYLQLRDRVFESVYDVKRLQPGRLRSRKTIRWLDRLVDSMTHDSSTLAGNSGSAVIDVSNGEVVGLHFTGEYLKANYCVPTYELARDSRVIDAGVNFAGRVDTNNEWLDAWRLVESRDASRGALLSAPHSPVNLSQGASAPEGGPSATIGWTIPLHVSISVGAPVLSAVPDASVRGGAAGEGLLGGGTPAVRPAGRFSLDSLEATSFHWQTALSMALASELAYSSPQVVRATALNDWGLQSCEFIEAADTQCFVASSPAAIVAAFRGTESIADWLADLNAVSTRTPYGTVHRGFYHAFGDVREQLRRVLSALGRRPILITGHSLGGALAAIAAAEWRDAFPVRFIYTCGQPRVGRSDFETVINERYTGAFFRFVNNRDIVPRVPPGYRHAGRLFHFDREGGLESSLEAAGSALSETEPPALTVEEFDSLRAGLLEARARTAAGEITELRAESVELEGLLPGVRDHRMENYIAKISQNAN